MNRTSDQFAWQMDRYLLDDMTAEERSAFESSLGDDSQVAETLEAETKLLTALAELTEEDFSPPEPVVPASVSRNAAFLKRDSVGWTWLASGLLAACLMAVASLYAVPGLNRSLDDRTLSSTDDEIGELARFWTEHRQLFVDQEQELEPISVPVRSSPETWTDVGTPDWMLAAVEAAGAEDSLQTEDEQWQ